MKILFGWVMVEDLELGNILPLGIGYLASNLPKKVKARMWDGILSKRPNDHILEEIKKFKPDIVGFSVWNFNLKAVQETVDEIKRYYPSVMIIV